MAMLSGPDALTSVIGLLPEAVREVHRLGGPGRPWFVRYGSREGVLRCSDPSRFRALQFTPELALASIRWLHGFLRDLAIGGFSAPEPIADLHGQSIATVDGSIWELVSFLPGLPMHWSEDEIEQAGRLLARFHESSLAAPARAQRPGSLPVELCRPVQQEARQLRSRLENELADIEHESATRGVVHGDATQSNVVIAADRTYRLVDYALAYHEVLLFDVGSALWRNGRSSPDAVTYDPRRVAIFVRGYAAVRSLAPIDARAIVVYMKCRGLQLQHRLELRQGRDSTIIQRLLSIDAQQSELERAIAEDLFGRR